MDHYNSLIHRQCSATRIPKDQDQSIQDKHKRAHPALRRVPFQLLYEWKENVRHCIHHKQGKQMITYLYARSHHQNQRLCHTYRGIVAFHHHCRSIAYEW